MKITTSVSKVIIDLTYENIHDAILGMTEGQVRNVLDDIIIVLQCISKEQIAGLTKERKKRFIINLINETERYK